MGSLHISTQNLYFHYQIEEQIDNAIISPSDVITIDNAIRSAVDGIIVNDEGKSNSLTQTITQVCQIICEIETSIPDQPIQDSSEEPIKLANKYVIS